MTDDLCVSEVTACSGGNPAGGGGGGGSFGSDLISPDQKAHAASKWRKLSGH